MIFRRRTPLEKEWARLIKQENAYLAKRYEKENSRLNALLEDKVPQGLQATLDNAFAKAFTLIFEKGTGIIEKTYNKEKARQDFRINEYTALIKNSRKSLKNVSKKAKSAGNVNMALSAVSGIGLGALGVGIPDIAIFTSLILKNLYQLATNYGFEYSSEKEKQFILMLIQRSVAPVGSFQELNEEIDHFIETGVWYEEKDTPTLITQTAACLSGELLYMKFLQGIPVVGVIGGSYNLIYMQQITKYSDFKYRRRFYIRQADRGMPLPG